MTALFQSIATKLQDASELSTQDPIDEEALTLLAENAQLDVIELLKLIADVESLYDFLDDPLAEDFVANIIDISELFTNAYANNLPLGDFTNVNQADSLVDLILEGITAAKAYRLQQSLL